MTTKKLINAVALCALFAVFAGADGLKGVVSFVDGSVEITRDGAFLDSSLIDIGLELAEFDSIETGEDGYLEVEMSVPEAGSIVKVGPGTVYYFEGTPRKSSRRRTTFQLLRGSLRLKVRKLAGDETMNVQTDTAVMAVRGTEFSVDTAADRSVLVTVSEGKVTSRAGRNSVEIEPGTAALLDEKGTLSTVSLDPDDIELYREYWRGLRLEALKINARLSIQQYARQWDGQQPKLEEAIRGLVASHNEVFKYWSDVGAGRRPAPNMERAIRDKMKLSRGMLEIRAVLPLIERTFHTLEGLEQAHRDGYAGGPLQAGSYSNAAAFYRSFNRDGAKSRKLLSLARRMIRLYRVVERAAGGGLSGSSGPSVMDSVPVL